MKENLTGIDNSRIEVNPVFALKGIISSPRKRPEVLRGSSPLQPPAQRASLRGMSPSGAEPGPEGAGGAFFLTG